MTPDEVDPHAGPDVTCRVNGEEVQRGNTGTLVFDSADLLAYISTFTVLRPGDLVLTGTPGGVGMGMTPRGSSPTATSSRPRSPASDCYATRSA